LRVSGTDRVALRISNNRRLLAASIELRCIGICRNARCGSDVDVFNITTEALRAIFQSGSVETKGLTLGNTSHCVVAGVVPHHVWEGRYDLVGVFIGRNVVLNTSLVRPVGRQASGLNCGWLVDLGGTRRGVERQSVSSTADLSTVTTAWRIAVSLVCRKSRSIVQEVVTETLDTEFHASKCVTETGTGGLARFYCEGCVIRLLVSQITSSQAVNIAALVNPPS
jgi:hypothetical protein